MFSYSTGAAEGLGGGSSHSTFPEFVNVYDVFLTMLYSVIIITSYSWSSSANYVHKQYQLSCGKAVD